MTKTAWLIVILVVSLLAAGARLLRWRADLPPTPAYMTRPIHYRCTACPATFELSLTELVGQWRDVELTGKLDGTQAHCPACGGRFTAVQVDEPASHPRRME